MRSDPVRHRKLNSVQIEEAVKAKLTPEEAVKVSMRPKGQGFDFDGPPDLVKKAREIAAEIVRQ
ncbi:MAG TPA: hypothetical protein VHD32_14080 [Candidatus Didemnitutus sp.]|nr:hypothetical protein [Candidatus Didemnitutus sp.]